MNVDPVTRDLMMRLYCFDQSAKWTAQRARAARLTGRPPGPEGSIGKLASSHIARACARLHAAMSGQDALLTGDDSPMAGVIAEILVSVPATSIAGGTDEIQRNIISERVLKMPRERLCDVSRPGTHRASAPFCSNADNSSISAAR